LRSGTKETDWRQPLFAPVGQKRHGTITRGTGKNALIQALQHTQQVPPTVKRCRGLRPECHAAEPQRVEERAEPELPRRKSRRNN
jgi:hypothetical protein